MKLNSGASGGMSSVDMLLWIQQKFCEHGVVLNSWKATPLKFASAEGAEDSSTDVMSTLLFMVRVVVVFLLNTPGSILLGEDTDKSQQLVVDHESGDVHSKRSEVGLAFDPSAPKLSSLFASDTVRDKTLAIHFDRCSRRRELARRTFVTGNIDASLTNGSPPPMSRTRTGGEALGGRRQRHKGILKSAGRSAQWR